ncbi:MAG: FAD:protein FMN transferase [Paracoccaceae bacterium]
MTTRRRFLTILAGAAALPVIGAGASSASTQWRGIALGAEARIILDHPDADRLISSAVNEIHRLEGIFSLYKNDSQISRVNRDGILYNPAFEMIELLSICTALHSRTSGAFDPTVQSLWALYAQMYSGGKQPEPEQIVSTLELTGWDKVQFSSEKISFDRNGVQITLNGIAQGYIADKIAGFFRREGVHNVLINTGEIAALGSAPDGNGWEVRVKGDQSPALFLNDAAIATSAPLGTTLDTNGSVGHIIDPRSGLVASEWSQVSVIEKSAAVADGLSTAFCLMKRADINASKGSAQVIFL